MTRQAGATIRAAAALRRGQQTYNGEQVAYLMALAYDSGRTATYLADVAELHCTWQDNAGERKTYEQRVAERLAEMERHAERVNAQLGRPPGWTYTGGPVNFETGEPVRRLEIAA